MFVIWNDEKHSVGIPDIDSQHKELFLIANQLADVEDNLLRQARIINIIKRLYAYTKYHFSTEEGMFSYYGYPQTAQHKAIHQSYGDKVKDFLLLARANPHFETAPVLDFLVAWIVNHIQVEDHAYAEHFRDAGIQVSIHFSPLREAGAEASQDPAKGVVADALALWNQQKMTLELQDIDRQHKELVYILQQANDLTRTSAVRQHLYLRPIIQRLFYYAQYHFSWEEEHMSQHGYPALFEHRSLHESFIKHVRDYSDAYRAKQSSLSLDITEFLRNWIISHILVEDRKFKDFLHP